MNYRFQSTIITRVDTRKWRGRGGAISWQFAVYTYDLYWFIWDISFFSVKNKNTKTLVIINHRTDKMNLYIRKNKIENRKTTTTIHALLQLHVKLAASQMHLTWFSLFWCMVSYIGGLFFCNETIICER